MAGIGLKPTPSAPKTLSFEVIWILERASVDVGLLESDQWGFCLILAPHSLSLFLSLAVVWDKDISSLFTPTSPQHLWVSFQRLCLFPALVTRSTVPDLQFSIYFVLFTPGQLSLLRGRVLGSFSSCLICGHEEGLCTQRSPGGGHEREEPGQSAMPNAGTGSLPFPNFVPLDICLPVCHLLSTFSGLALEVQR